MPSQFSPPSFSASASGPNLTGAANGQGSGAYNLTGITYAPDGDVLGATDSVNGQWAYQYGPLNRLLLACSPNCSSPATELQYAHDRKEFPQGIPPGNANRWQENVLAGSGPSAQLSFDANNHVTGASYDASGDLLAEGSETFTYDAEGRTATADGGAVKYVYDAFGHRVEKITPAGTFYFLHDLDGRPVTELNSSGQWIRGEVLANGHHLATYNNGIFFDYSDWLGTERMRATQTGYEANACASLPYGADLNCSASDPSPMHFTGQVRDQTTGLDHFPARYYNSLWGQFTRPDPGPWNLADPQTPDRYVYTTDSPVTLVDPTGLFEQAPAADGGDGGNSGTAPCAPDQNCGKKPSNSLVSKLKSAWRAFLWSHPAIAGVVTRHMGSDEAKTAAQTGKIPNAYKGGEERPTHFTRDGPVNNAKAAQERYELKETPTHRASVPEERVPTKEVPPNGPKTSGGGDQFITREPVSVSPDEIYPLDPEIEIPIDPLLIPFP